MSFQSLWHSALGARPRETFFFGRSQPRRDLLLQGKPSWVNAEEPASLKKHGLIWRGTNHVLKRMHMVTGKSVAMSRSLQSFLLRLAPFYCFPPVGGSCWPLSSPAATRRSNVEPLRRNEFSTWRGPRFARWHVGPSRIYQLNVLLAVGTTIS